MPESDFDLFKLIDTRDAAQLEARVSRLLSQGVNGIAAANEHWVEILLAWHLAGSTMRFTVAERFLETLTENRLFALDGTLYEHFLPAAANAVLGIQAFETTDTATIPAYVGYAEISRSLAFGMCQNEWLPSYIQCARDACKRMHGLDFVEAIHALCCLSILHRNQVGSVYYGHLETFLREARHYLGWAATALENSRLAWEIRVWDTLLSLKS